MKYIGILIAAILVGFALPADAAVNQALMCKVQVGVAAECPASSTRFVTPVLTSRIRTADGWMLWADVKETASVYVCRSNLVEGQSKCPTADLTLIPKCDVVGMTCEVMKPGSIRLRWPVPTLNTDDTAITNLAGFEIHSAAVGSPLGLLLDIPNPTQTSVDLKGYLPGQYQFGLKAYNSDSKRSELTAVITKTVDKPIAKTPKPPAEVTAEFIPAE